MIGLLFWSFVVVVLLLLCVSDHGLVSSLNSEGYALLSFKQYISEDPDGSLSNWNMSDDTPCLWNGITCKEQRVVSVSIPKKKLFGFLGFSALGSLPDLRHVNLRNNKLYGSLFSDLFKDLRLQSLVLSGNSFSGFVPSQIGDLHYLQTLDLSQNFFNGSIPTAILQCKRLKYLNLGHNNFTGSLPNGIGINLTSLEKLDLSFNKFGGPIPSDMGNLSSLQGTVDFSHNRFNGSIPASLGNLPEKVYIDLTFNNLNGPIPQNGALMNRGPTAFLGNPELCGPPLKTPCSPDTPGARASAHSPSSFPFLPHSSDDAHKNGKGKEGLSRRAIIIIIVCDVVGVCLVALLFSCCYSRIFACYETKDENEYALEKIGKLKRKDCFCFGNEESETPSENVDHYDLVPLDTQVGFDLDELLKASAFVLGKSGIGIVYKVVLEDGLILAVRRLGEGGSQRFKEFQTEVEAIGKLRHPNVVTLRAYYWSVDEKLLIYDYIPNGNLSTAIHGMAGSISFTPLPWSTRLRIMIGIARGLVYLHEFSPKKYVHGDLKPNNILLGENMEPHIADFGLGRLANIAGSYPTLQSDRTPEKQLPRQNSTGPASSEAFTPGAILASLGSCYQAPEALKAAKPSQKWDVYSYGVILLEMITGRLPLVQVGTLEMDLVRWIQLCIEEKKPLSDVLDFYLAEDADCDEEMVAVLKVAMACVHASSEKRPAMRHVYDALERLRMNSA